MLFLCFFYVLCHLSTVIITHAADAKVHIARCMRCVHSARCMHCMHCLWQVRNQPLWSGVWVIASFRQCWKSLSLFVLVLWLVVENVIGRRAKLLYQQFHEYIMPISL